jgi:hypothetical protein
MIRALSLLLLLSSLPLEGQQAIIEPSIAIGHIAGRLQELSSATNGNDMMSISGSKLRSNHPKYQLKRCTTTQHRTRRINALEHLLPFSCPRLQHRRPDHS